MIHRLKIDDKSRKQWWKTNEKATFKCSAAEFKDVRLRIPQIWIFPIKFSKTIELECKRALFWILREKQLIGVLKNDFSAYRGTFERIVMRRNITCLKKVSGRFFCKKYMETFFGLRAKKFRLVLSNPYLRVRVSKLGKKTSKQLPSNQKLSYVSWDVYHWPQSEGTAIIWYRKQR